MTHNYVCNNFKLNEQFKDCFYCNILYSKDAVGILLILKKGESAYFTCLRRDQRINK